MRDTNKSNSIDPTLPAVAIWLKRIDRGYLHTHGWTVVNKRFHGLTMAARPFLNKHFKDADQQEAAFDGMTLALLTLAHFADIEKLSGALGGTLLANTAERDAHQSAPHAARDQPT